MSADGTASPATPAESTDAQQHQALLAKAGGDPGPGYPPLTPVFSLPKPSVVRTRTFLAAPEERLAAVDDVVAEQIVSVWSFL